MKVETDVKVKKVNNENEKINEAKKNQLTSIKERLEKEKAINADLKEKIKDAEKRIKQLTSKIESTSVQENKKNIAILKELADINREFSEKHCGEIVAGDLTKPSTCQVQKYN